MSATPFIASGTVSRHRRPAQADERTTLVAFLRWHRETLKLKCADLVPAQLARRSVGSSALSLLGLVRHAAESERFWFRQVMAAEASSPWFGSGNPDDDFDVTGADEQTVTQAFHAWQTEVAFADHFIDPDSSRV